VIGFAGFFDRDGGEIEGGHGSRAGSGEKDRAIPDSASGIEDIFFAAKGKRELISLDVNAVSPDQRVIVRGEPLNHKH
jgi:hypothetical protein